MIIFISYFTILLYRYSIYTMDTTSTDNTSLRSPPDGYESMTTFQLACNFSSNIITCSDEVVNTLKERLNINGRKLTILRPNTAHLIGMEPEFVNVINNDTAAVHSAITLLVSPPTDGYWSTHPFWHTYDISVNSSEPRIGIPWG